MPSSDEIYWTTDEDLFLALDGGKKVADWFGFVPSFHDATLDKLTLSGGSGTISLRAFRTTSEVDADGYFVLDKHALVDIFLDDITGIILDGDATSIVLDLCVRRLPASNDDWKTVAGPVAGNIEVKWESSCGLRGGLCARNVRFSLNPL